MRHASDMNFSRFVSCFVVSLSIAAVGCSDSDPVPTADAGTDSAVHNDGDVATDMPVTLDASPGDDMSVVDMTVVDAGPALDGGEEFTQSYIRESCGPADGPAFELSLFNAAVPTCTIDPELEAMTFYVHNLSGAPIPPTAGTTITSTEASSSGTANRCPGGTVPCESTENWTLSFSSYEAGSGAVGTYSVTWADSSVSTGQFIASWCTGAPSCI